MTCAARNPFSREVRGGLSERTTSQQETESLRVMASQGGGTADWPHNDIRKGEWSQVMMSLIMDIFEGLHGNLSHLLFSKNQMREN